MSNNGSLLPDAVQWPTGFACPVCGVESTATRVWPPPEGVTYAMVECHLDLLNERGGALKTSACKHAFEVRPGSRRT